MLLCLMQIKGIKQGVPFGILIFEDLIKSRLDLFLDKFFKVILPK